MLSMAYSRPPKDFGAKLLPKIVTAVSQSVIITKRGLASHEHLVRVKAMQHVIDQAGHEMADLHRPILHEMLKSDAIHPLMREYLGKIASGEHQWQALALGGIVGGGVSNVFGNAINNELFPVLRDIIASNPHLVPTPGVLATLVAHGWLDGRTGELNTLGQGLNNTYWQAL